MSKVNRIKIPEHDELMARIRKTLYYGPSLKCPNRISRPMAELSAEFFSETHKNHSLNRLNYTSLGKYNNVTPCPLLIALIYLDRLNNTDPTFARRITPSELFLVSLMVSTKFYCGHDEEIYISDWADYGNISAERMMEIELEFLSAMDWNLYVSNEEFFDKLEEIEVILAKRQGFSRGWLTYTELMQLLPSLSLAREIVTFTSLICIGYTASVLAIVGAFFVASYVPGTALYNKSAPTEPSTSIGQPTTNCTLNHINPTTDVIDPFDNDAELLSEENTTQTNFILPPLASSNNNEIILADTDFLFGSKFGFMTGVLEMDRRDDNASKPDKTQHNYTTLLLMLFHNRRASSGRSHFHDFDPYEYKETLPFVWSTFL